MDSEASDTIPVSQRVLPSDEVLSAPFLLCSEFLPEVHCIVFVLLSLFLARLLPLIFFVAVLPLCVSRCMFTCFPWHCHIHPKTEEVPDPSSSSLATFQSPNLSRSFELEVREKVGPLRCVSSPLFCC